MARREELDRKQLMQVIYAKQGVLSEVARSLNVSLQTIYNYRDKYATVAQAIDESRNTFDTELLDEAEIKLREAVRSGSAWAVRYTLGTKGKARGYVERQEITGADGSALEVVIKYAES